MPISFEGQIYTHTVILQTKKECKVSAWQRWLLRVSLFFALLNFIYHDLFAVGSDVKQHIDGRFSFFS